MKPRRIWAATARRTLNLTLMLAIAVIALLMGVTPSVQAAAIPIANAGFENPALTTEGDYTDRLIPGWMGISTPTDYANGTFNPTAAAFPAQAPEGINIAFIQRGAIFQTLTEVLALGQYRLSVQVGDSLPDPVSPFTVELRAGGAVLAQSSSPIPADGTFSLVTVNYEALEGDPSLGQFLELRLVDNGFDYDTEPYFDDVRLNFELRQPDFDGSGGVDGGDLARWRSGFGTGSTHMQGDANGYGGIDGADFLIWQRHLGSPGAVASARLSSPQASTTASAGVPEPASLCLAALSVLVVTFRARMAGLDCPAILAGRRR